MKSIQYNYIIQNISEDPNDPAYKAYIPKLNCIVFGDNLKELEEGIIMSIDGELKDLKAAGKPIPKPDTVSKYSGKFVMRINPNLHERMAIEAMSIGKSLNKYVEEKLMANTN